MTIDEMKEQILSNLVAAIINHDNGVMTEYRISTSSTDDIIDFDSNDTIQFYLPYKLSGHRMLGRLKLTVELED